jgi:hypothetical protein
MALQRATLNMNRQSKTPGSEDPGYSNSGHPVAIAVLNLL